MNNTTYIHAQNEENLITSAQFIDTTKVNALNMFGSGSQLTVFMSDEQILQLHATLGAYIAENHDKFVKHEITKVGDVK